MADVYAFYGDGAQEELDCVPANSGGAWLSRALIESRMSADTPVLRWKCRSASKCCRTTSAPQNAATGKRRTWPHYWQHCARCHLIQRRGLRAHGRPDRARSAHSGAEPGTTCALHSGAAQRAVSPARADRLLLTRPPASLHGRRVRCARQWPVPGRGCHATLRREPDPAGDALRRLVSRAYATG